MCLDAGCSGLVVMCLTVVWENPGLNHIVGICVGHDSHCDIQPNTTLVANVVQKGVLESIYSSF